MPETGLDVAFEGATIETLVAFTGGTSPFTVVIDHPE